MTVSLKLKSFIALLMTAVLLIFPNSAAFAQEPQIKINHVTQKKDRWCWVAASVMLLDLYGIKMTQDEYAKFVNGHTDNVSIPAFEFKSSLNKKGIYGDTKNGPATWEEITTSIDKGYPVIAFQTKASGRAHLIIINGYYTEGKGDNGDNRFLIMNDPSGGEDWETYNDFRYQSKIEWYGSWLNVRNTKNPR